MKPEEFIDLQSRCYALESALISTKYTLPKQLELSSVINNQVVHDFGAFYRAKYFCTNPESFLPLCMTAGVGLPLRLVAYYDRQPMGFVSGIFIDNMVCIYACEVSERADDELRKEWVFLVLEALNNLNIFLSECTRDDYYFSSIAFLNPSPHESEVLSAANIAYDESAFKGVPGYIFEI